jgi:hypothetical protein
MSRIALGALAALSISVGAPLVAQAEEPAQSPAQSHGQQQLAPPHHDEPDNGTDPTRVQRSITVDFEHTDLRRDFTSDTLELVYNQPLGRHTALNATVPFPSIDVAGNAAMGFGDVELLLTHIPVLTRKYGIVIKGGATFDTASRPELGSGNTVLEATAIYARFLTGGAIFAPSLEYNYGIDRDAGRSRVNRLTLDLYYVPKLKNRAYYMTFDPFVIADFETGKQSAGLSVTLGRVIGQALGGRLQAYVKPSAYVGHDREANWGIETGLKLLGF